MATSQSIPEAKTTGDPARPGRRLNVLILVTDLDAGTGTYCRCLASGLRRFHGEEFHVGLLPIRGRALSPEDPEIFDSIHTLNSPVHTDWRRFYETLVDAGRVRRLVGELRPDVIVAVATYSNLLATLVLPDTPSILTMHTHLTTQLEGSRFGGIIRGLVRWCYPGRCMVAPATGVAEDLANNYGIHGAQIIYHGVDTENIRALADQSVPDLPEGPYCVACARLAPQKDYPCLLRAYAQARGRGMRERLVILGDGPLRGELETLASQLQIREHVLFMGNCPNPFPYMKRARFLALSSVWEGFGLVLVEAMVLGVPCISTDCPSGPAEILEGGRSGLVTPVGDVGALADAMARLSLSDELHQSLAQRSLARAGDFSLQRMARQYRDLIFRRAGRLLA